MQLWWAAPRPLWDGGAGPAVAQAGQRGGAVTAWHPLAAHLPHLPPLLLGHCPSASPAREAAADGLLAVLHVARGMGWPQVEWPVAGALALAAATGGYLWLLRRRQQQFRQLRSRLADDLHDKLGALLVRASFRAEALKYEQPAQHATADHLLVSLSEASRAMRDIAWGIDPNASTLGSLFDRMQEYIDQLPASGRCQARITGAGIANEKGIAPATRQHIYYIFKEAVTNALRHANPCSLLTISLQQRGHSLVLQVANDGPPVGPLRPGMGLRSMRRRAREVGGHLETAPCPGGGFAVRLTVPLQGVGFLVGWGAAS